jgi:hypothetical protein
MRALVAAVAAVAALAVPTAAFAYTVSGKVRWYDEVTVCNGCLVKIHNNTTGANGSTYTNSNGDWSATGFVAGYSYTTTMGYFGIPGCDYGDVAPYTWIQPGSNRNNGNDFVNGHAYQGGCPIYPQG